MSEGKLEKMDKDFSPQVDILLPETEALAKVIKNEIQYVRVLFRTHTFFFTCI